MRAVHVTATWRSTVEIEVPNDLEECDLMELPEDLLDQVDTSGAELVDWSMKWRNR